MSPRKRNAKAGSSKQPTLNSYFASKSRHGPAPTATKRLAQSSLAARPLRSKRSPDPNEILDLTQSTSPTPSQLDSPQSSKKRKLVVTVPDRSPTRGAQRDPFGSSLSPLSDRLSPSSPAPNPRPEPFATPAKPDESQSLIVSPSPIQNQRSLLSMPDDPDEIIESSQTQYLHLRFTPSSQRIATVDAGHVSAPVFTPVSNRTRGRHGEVTSRQIEAETSHILDHSPTVFHVPSSQGEASKSPTPRKRNWASIDDSEIPIFSKPAELGIPGDTPAGSSTRGPDNDVSPPTATTSTKTPSKTRLLSVNTPASRFASPRPLRTPRYLDKLDHVPSSQGEPTLEATELGTVESPPKPPKQTGAGIALLPCIPSSSPSGQSNQKDAPLAPQQGGPPLPVSNFDHAAPRSPHHNTYYDLSSSPTDLPSPGRLMSSLGFGASEEVGKVPAPRLTQAPTPMTRVEKRAFAPGLPIPPDCDHMSASSRADQSPSRMSDKSPSRRSSQTVIPSSQPAHDSSPPPDYDIDPRRHAFNQSRLQSLLQPPPQVQPPSAFGSRVSSHSKPSVDSNRQYFTAPTHRSTDDSSQSLPPSQSPIKGSRVDPNQSAAGVQGVFGMLGFGSEADIQEDIQTGAHQVPIEEDLELHISVYHDLPPSSPPPQTPPHERSRESSPDSYLVPAGEAVKRKHFVQKTSLKDSSLTQDFEAARKRSKTTPSSVRDGSTSKFNQIFSSPIRGMNQMDLDSSPIRDSRLSGKRQAGTNKSRTQTRNRIASGRGSAVSTRSRRVQKNLEPLESQSPGPSRTPASARMRKDPDNEIVESSDTEEAMQFEPLQSPQKAPTSAYSVTRRTNNTRPLEDASATSRKHGRSPVSIHGDDDDEIREKQPVTPARTERLPSSVSPSPIRIRGSPPVQDTRMATPPSENTQTQEESETPWESLRPSQSVSQVFERRLIEAKAVEAKKGGLLRIEQEVERQNAQKIEDQEMKQVQGVGEAEGGDGEAESLERPVRPVAVSFDPRSPTNVSNNTPQMPPWFTASTPRSRRVTGREIYIVTPTKAPKRTPASARRGRSVMTPSSMAEEDEDPDQEYTYVDETFNPTESQQSFLNRILQGPDSEID